MSETSEYRGSGLVVRYDVKRCIHAAECVKGLPQVFDPNAKPWVQPGKAAADQVIAVIGRCPTGALSVTKEDGQACEQTPVANEARLVADGPIYLHGDIEIYDGDGKLTGRETRVALCRCGASKNKPFCDNSHGGAGFRHDGSCGETDQVQALAAGKLKLTVFPGGPVQCDGPLSILDAFGEVAARTEQCWFCRCGGSANKPFCDGSHKTIGFTG